MTIRERLSLPREVWREFNKDNGAILAAAVSFYEFLSLFPLLLAAVGILGFVLQSPQHAEEIVRHSVGHFFLGSQATAIFQEIIHGRSTATGIGLLLLVWSGMSAMVVLEQAMNLAWDVTESRSFVKRRAIVLLTLLVAGLLLVVSFGMTTLLHAARASSPEALSKLSTAWTLLGYCIPALLSIAMFVLLYKVLPNTRVTWRTALVAGVFSGALWEIAKQVFTYYAVTWASYSKVYGPLTGVILLMIWIYYSSIIAIVGAEFGAVWSERRKR